jgi:hypothetical protein
MLTIIIKKSPVPFMRLHCRIIMTVFTVLIKNRNTALYTWHEYELSRSDNTYYFWN